MTCDIFLLRGRKKCFWHQDKGRPVFLFTLRVDKRMMTLLRTFLRRNSSFSALEKKGFIALTKNESTHELSFQWLRDHCR